MAEYSIPVFVKFKDKYKIDLNKKATAICQCPLPITDEGEYIHIVEYEKSYICRNCGLMFSVGKIYPV